ncbi:MAG: hypothetical protein IKE65_09085 [Clostridia bacterium]|nr:hypothetical protein [Clostridia bacterium]
MQKKIQAAVAILLCAVLAVIPLSGVKDSFSVQNVEKSAMVKSIGFDEGENSATISYVTGVIADNSASHAQALISAPGGSFAEAEKKAQILADKYLTFSYAKHFVIGMDTAKNSTERLLDFLLASPVLQLSSYIYLCEDSARELLREVSKDDISTNEVLTNLNLAGKEEGYYAPVTVLSLAKAAAEHTSIAIPIIGKQEQGENSAKKTVLVFKGYGVLQDGSLRTILNPARARAYNILMNQVERTVAECDKSDILLKKMRCTKRLEMEGEQVKAVHYHIKATAEFASFSGESLEDESFVSAQTEQEKKLLLSEICDLLDFLREKHLDALHLMQEADILSGGKAAPEAPEQAAYTVEISQHLEKAYNLK